MKFDEARETVLALLRQQGKAKNSEMLAHIGGDTALLELVREDLLFEALADDMRGAGLRYTGPDIKATSDGDAGPVKLFLSYGRRDASVLAERLEKDLKRKGFQVWRDTREIKPGTNWHEEITDGLRSSQIVVALMTPHSTRTTRDAASADSVDSVCLGEIAYALFQPPAQPVVPVMAQTCEPPLAIFHLDYVDLRQWQDNEEQYQVGLERLLDGIAAARRGEKRYRSWHHLLDPFDFAAFLHAKREGFTGRRWLFDAIDLWRTTGGGGRVLLIKGDPGTGKSAVVAELVHRNPGGQVLAYHCCQWDVGDTLEPWRFVRSISAMIAGKLEEYAAQLADPNLRDILSEKSCRRDPASAFERGVLTPLEKLHAPEGGPRYLLIDALDEALAVSPGEPDLVSLLASRVDRLPPWIRLVATTRKESTVLDRLSGFGAREIEAQSLENLTDLRAYICNRIESRALAERVREEHLSVVDFTSQLVEKSKGNFLYARQALDGISTGCHSFSMSGELPPGLGGLYAQRFSQLYPDEMSFASVAVVLEVICAAREPLDVSLIATATGLDPDAELPRIISRLSGYVTRHPGADGRALFAVYHKSLSDWLTDENRAGQLHWVSVKQGHRRLGALAWNEFKNIGGELPRYLLRHAVTHLIPSESWSSIIGEDDEPGLLCDLRFIEAKCSAGLGLELLADYDVVLGALSELREERVSQMAREQACKAYALSLEDCFRRRQAGKLVSLPSPPRACRPSIRLNSEIIEGTAFEGATRVSRVRQFFGFVNRCCHILGEHPEWTKLKAANYGDESAVSRQGEALCEQSLVNLLQRRPGNPHPPLHPACRAILKGHNATVRTLAVSADFTRAISGSDDTTLRLWDIASGVSRVLLGHGGSVRAVVVSHDFTMALSGSDDETLRLWDLVSGECRVFEGHIGGIKALAVSPDFSRAVSGSDDGTLRTWDLGSGESRVLKGHTRSVMAIAANTDLTRAISGSRDGTFRFWNLISGESQLFKSPRVQINSLVANVEFTQAISGGGNSLRLWDLATGESRIFPDMVTDDFFLDDGISPMAQRNRHAGEIMSVAASADFTYAISGSGFGTGDTMRTLRIWNLRDWDSFFLQGADEVNAVVVSADFSQALSGGSSRTLQLWDLSRGEAPNRVRDSHDAGVNVVLADFEASIALSGSDDRTLRLWNLASGDSRSFRVHTGRVHALSVSADYVKVLSGGRDNSLHLLNVADGKCRRFVGHTANINSVAASADFSQAITCSDDQTLRLWHLDSGESRRFEGHTGSIRAIVMNAEFSRAISCSEDHTLRIWELESGGSRVLSGHDREVTSVAASADFSQALSGSADTTLRLWDMISGESRVLKGHSGAITSVIACPNFAKAFSASDDGTIRIWDLCSGQCRVLAGHGGGIKAFAVSADLSMAVSGGDDETLRLWDLTSESCLALYHADSPIRSLAVNFGLARYICGCEDGQVHFLTLRHGRELSRERGSCK